MFLLTTAAASPFALSRWADFFANFGEFAKGFLYTLGMSFCALLLAFVLGVIFGAMSSSKSKVLKAIARVYVEVFQNTPLLVQFVFVYYGLAIMTNGLVMISTFFTAVLCVGIYHGLTSPKLFVQVSKQFQKGKQKPRYHKDSLIVKP